MGDYIFLVIESLRNDYDNIKDEEDEVIADYIDKKNLLSLRPIITEKNENIIAEKTALRFNNLKQKVRTMSDENDYLFTEDDIIDDIDDLEDIIGDDAFAAFLNSDGEIHVADKIYKYTDVGLFIVKEDKYSELGEYLKAQKISDNLLIPTKNNIKEKYIRDHMPPLYIDTMPISRDIDYFIEVDPKHQRKYQYCGLA